MLSTYNRALAPGTYANRFKQAKYHVTFCLLYNVDVLHPTIVYVCMYAQYLANAFKAVNSVKNYLSGARTWITQHGGDVNLFNSNDLELMIKSLAKDSTHVVNRAYPLTVQNIIQISCFLDISIIAPLSVKACILLGYSCYLRTSNLLFSQFPLQSHTHTLLAKHVSLSPQGLKVLIVSTKSRSKPYALTVGFNPDRRICPVRAWTSYTNSIQLFPNSPAFMLDRYTPLTSTMVVKLMREALKNNPDVPTHAVTMHSLRRGAAQSAESAGAPRSDIMKRGGWNSKAGLKPYLTS